MRPYRAISHRASLLLLVCLLAACSTLRLGYANGDTFVYWWLNGYVDFNNDQKPWIKVHIDHLFDWHRKTQLNDYAQLLMQVQQRVSQGKATPAEVQADFAAIKKRAALVLDAAVPELTDLALSLQPQQIAHLEKKFAANNEKFRKEYLMTGTVEDRQRVRYKKVMKQAEYWFGDFSPAQQAQIRAASDARPLDYELWLAERVRRQQEMIRMLKRIQAERPGREVVAGMLREYIARSFENFTYAEHKGFFDASGDGMGQMVALIVNLATVEQRGHAVKSLQRLIEDCHALAEKGR